MEQEIEIDVMIADASHEVYVDTSGFPGLGYRETHQRHDFPTCPHALAESEDIQPYLRRCRDEDEYRAGICTGYVLRLDGR